MSSPHTPRTLPRIALASLGGTITMTPSAGGGVKPTLSAADLISSVPALADVADLRTHTVSVKPSGSLTFADVMDAVEWASEQVRGGASGAVIVQGTDTLEESAYLADLLWEHREPLVFTGAMRSAAGISSDGAANLLASAIVAGSSVFADSGAFVVLDNTVHFASRVVKGHTTSLSTFCSPNGGPAGFLHEHTPVRANTRRRLSTPALRRCALRVRELRALPPVAVLTAALDEGGLLTELLAGAGYRGLIVAGAGSGHVSGEFVDRIASVARDMPVVVSSRTGSGSTTLNTYAYAGSERDLQQREAVMSGWLDPLKSRLLLGVLLAGGLGRAEIYSEIAMHGSQP